MASILLIERDPDVRRLLLILLTDLGHRAQALERDAEIPPAIDVLMLDPTSGVELEQARRARAQNPALPIVCMRFAAEASFLGEGPLSYLPKPFTAHELGQAIELALD
jgi:CheY-like chemotaxis protein